jgi:hypothetical protein
MYLNDHADRFPDRRDLKTLLPSGSGYHPWTTWPPSDPRGGWAALVLQDEGASYFLWSCPAAILSPVGNIVQSLQPFSTDTNAPVSRYWLWRFDRPDDPVSVSKIFGAKQNLKRCSIFNLPTTQPSASSAVRLMLNWLWILIFQKQFQLFLLECPDAPFTLEAVIGYFSTATLNSSKMPERHCDYPAICLMPPAISVTFKPSPLSVRFECARNQAF